MVFIGEDSKEILIIDGEPTLWRQIVSVARADRKSKIFPASTSERLHTGFRLSLGPSNAVREFAAIESYVAPAENVVGWLEPFNIFGDPSKPRPWYMNPDPRFMIITKSGLRFVMPLVGPRNVGFLDRSGNYMASRLYLRTNYSGERFLAIDEWTEASLEKMVTRRPSMESVSRRLEDAVCAASITPTLASDPSDSPVTGASAKGDVDPRFGYGATVD